MKLNAENFNWLNLDTEKFCGSMEELVSQVTDNGANRASINFTMIDDCWTFFASGKCPVQHSWARSVCQRIREQKAA